MTFAILEERNKRWCFVRKRSARPRRTFPSAMRDDRRPPPNFQYPERDAAERDAQALADAEAGNRRRYSRTLKYTVIQL
jgi:hypothetical protein